MDSEKQMTSRQLQAIERRQQLIDAAKKLFAKNGYHNTSVRSITQSIGMADGLIYHYFPKGKLEILHTIIEEGCEVLNIHVDEILQFINDEMTLNEAMMYFCKEARSTFKADNELIIIMVREKELLGKETSELLLKTFAKFWTKVNNLIVQRAKKSEIKELDFAMATHQIMTTVASTLFMDYLTANVSQFDSNDYIKRLVDFTVSPWKKLD